LTQCPKKVPQNHLHNPLILQTEADTNRLTELDDSRYDRFSHASRTDPYE